MKEMKLLAAANQSLQLTAKWRRLSGAFLTGKVDFDSKKMEGNYSSPTISLAEQAASA